MAERGRATEAPRAEMKHHPRGVDVGVGRDQPVGYRSVPVLSRDEQRAGPILRSEILVSNDHSNNKK